MDAKVLGRRLARLGAAELEETLAEYLDDQADEVACALTVELVRRAREGELYLNGYLALLRKGDVPASPANLPQRRGA